MKTQALLLLGLEAWLAGVELLVGQLEPVVLAVEGNPPDRHGLLAAQIALPTRGRPGLVSGLGRLRLIGAHTFLPATATRLHAFESQPSAFRWKVERPTR